MTSMSDGEQEFIDCANCTLLVHRRIHVKCCECPSSFCIQCFRMGCETGAHRRGHNYEIRDPVGEPTFEGKGSWGCIEEARLLVAAHRYKLGNWGEMINMMESDRQAHQAQEYFDRCFIRGPFGQFALKGINWADTKRAMVADGSIDQLLRSDSDRIQRMLLIMDALRSSQEIFNPEDPDLDRIINDLVERHIEEFKANIRDKPTPIRQIGDKLSIEEVLSDDSNDLSDDVDGCEKNKALDDAEMTGLEPENDSDDEDVPPIPIVVLQKVKDKGKVEMKSEIRDKKALRKSLVISPAILRSSKGNRSSQRKSVQDTIKKTRYQRVQQESSSSDDDVEDDANESDKADTEQLSLNDGDETTHGLEDSAVGCEDDTSSESEIVSNKPSAGKLATHCHVPIIVRKKRRAKIISKKQRRLKEFQKRMARNTKARERRLHELTELCPRQMISELRVSAPRLALDREKNIIERPKLRQDDLNMLAYNVDRDDFELEWFNDAEHLISRLHIHRSVDKMGDIDNDIKFARVQKYLRILKARKAKRRAIIEHDKITEFFNFMMNMTLEKRKASEIMAERSGMEKLLTRAQQTLTREELDDLSMNIEKADQLIERISRLKELQRNGVTSLKEDAWLVTVMYFWNRTRILFHSSIRLFYLIHFVMCYLSTTIFMYLISKKSRCNRNKKRRYQPRIADGILINAVGLNEMEIYYSEIGYSSVCNYGFQFVLPRPYKGISILQEQVQYWGAMNSGNQNSHWSSFEISEGSRNTNNYTGNSSVNTFDFGFSDLYHEDFNLGSDFNDAPSLDDIQVTPMDDPPRRKEENHDAVNVTSTTFSAGLGIQLGRSTAQNNLVGRQHSIRFEQPHNELSGCASSSGCSDQEFISNYVIGNVYKGADYSANIFPNRTSYDNFTEIPNFQEDMQQQKVSMHVVTTDAMKTQEQQSFERQFFLPSFNQHQFETSQFNQTVQDNIKTNISNDSVTPIVIATKHHSIDNQMTMTQNTSHQSEGFQNQTQRNEEIPYESTTVFSTGNIASYSGSCNRFTSSTHDKTISYGQDALYNPQIAHNETDTQQAQQYFDNQCIPLWEDDSLANNVFNNLPSSMQRTEYRQKEHVHKGNIQYQRTIPVINVTDHTGKIDGQNTVRQHGNSNMPNANFISPYQPDLGANEIIEIVDEGNVRQLNINNNGSTFSIPNTSRLQQVNTDKGYGEVLLQEQEMKRLQRIEQHPLVKEKQHQYRNEQIQMEQQQHFDFEKQHFQMGQQYVQLGLQHLQIEQQQHLHIGQLQHLQTGQQQHQQVEHHQLDVVGQQHLQDRQHNHKQREQKYLQVEQQQLLQMEQESHHPSDLIQHHLQIQHSNQQKQRLLNLGQQQNPQKLLCTQYDAQQKQRQVQEKDFSEVEQLGQLQSNFVLQDLQLGQHQYVKREEQKHEEKTYQVEQKQEQQRKIDQEQRRLLFSVKNEPYQSNVVENTNHQTNIFEVNQDQGGNQLCFQQDAVQQQFLYHQTSDQKIAHIQYENTKSILPGTVYSGGIIQNDSNQYVQDNFISPQDVNFGIASYIPNDVLYEKNLHSRSKFSTQYNKHSDEQYHKYDNPSIKELLVAPNQQPVSSASISLNIPIQHPTTNVEIMLNENSTYSQGSSRRSLINQVEKQANEPSINCQSVESSLEQLLESSKYVMSPSLSCKVPSAYETGDMNFEISGLKENSQYIADFSTTQIEEPRAIFEYSMGLQSIPFQNNTKDSLVITSTQSNLALQSSVSDIPSSSCNKPFEFTSAAASSRPSSVASDLFRELDFPLDCGDFCEWFLAENLNSLGDAATIEPFESVRPSSVMNRLEDLNFVDSNTAKEEKFAIKRGRGRPRKNIVESESLKNYSAETSGNISASMKCLEPDKRERSRKPPFLSVSMEGIKSNDYSVKHELKCRSRPMDRSQREKKTRSTERERLLDIAKRKPDVSSSLIGGSEPLTLYDRAKTNQRGAARQANERLKASRNREIEELNSSYLKPPLVCEKKTSPLKKATKLSPRTTDKTKKSTTVRQHGEITEHNVYEVKKVKTKDDCIKHITREEDKIETSICKQFNKKSNKASTCYTWKDKNYSNGFLLIPKISYVAKTNGKSEQNDAQIGLIISDLYEAEDKIIKQQNTQENIIFMNTINEYNIPCTSDVLATDLIFPSDQVPFSETQEVSTTYDGSTGWNLAGLDLETLEELREWMLFDFSPPLLHVPPVPVLLPSQVKAHMRSDHKQDTVDAELKEISWPKPNEYTTGKTFDGFQNWFPKQIKVSQHDYLDLPILFEPPLSREEFYAEYLKPMNELYMKTIKEKIRHIFTPWPKPDVKYSFTCDLLPIRTVKCGHSLPYLDLCNQVLSCKPRIKERDPLDDHYLRVLKERKERQITVSNVIESIVNRVLFLEDWPIIPKQQFSILYHGRLEESIIHHTPELVPAYLNIHTRHPKIDEIYTVDISLERDDSYEITKTYVEFQKEYCCEQLCLFENSKELYFEMIIQAETCEKIIPISRKYNSSLAVSDIDVMKTYQSEYSSTTTTFDIATTDRKMLSVSTVNYKLSRSLLVNESIEMTIAYSHMATSSLNIFDIHADMQRNHRITKDATFVNVLKNLEFFSCYMIDLNINLINKEVNNRIEKLLPVQVYAEDSLHIFTVQVIRKRQMEVKQHSIVRNIALGDFASFSVCSHVFCITEKQPSIKRNKGCEFIYPIAREKTVSFHMATTRFSRKRKMERADAIVVKKLALEDQVGFIVAVMDNQNKNNFREVTIMKDPRLPIKIARSVKEVEKKWIILAKHCQISKITPSVDQMSLTVLLQDLFANAMKIENTMTMKDLNDFITHQTHIFGFQFQKYTLADIEAKLNLELLSNFHVWDEFVKKSHARRAKYGVNREQLATLFLFLGSPRLPLFGRPWRQWLSPLAYKSTSTLANNLAICCRQITLSGMDDLEYSSQACKLWWVFMMCRDVVPWSVYPALTRRQLFMFVRLLEVLSDIKKPAFCFYPPRQFFEAVRLMMEHPKIHTIPKDIYHPDVTTFVSLKKSNEFRVFDIGHSLPDILCYWMDDMDRLDGYLHGDICIAHFDNNMFPSQTEWIWMNYGRDIQHLVFPMYTKEKIINKIDDCLTDSKISLNLRKKISLFKNALEIDQNLNKSSIDLMPFDLLDPFALSPTFIDHLPISEQFQKEFHDAICQALINKSQLHHQLLRKKDIVNLLKWNKRTSERLDLDGKHTSVGRSVSGRATTIDKICKGFWIKPIKSISTTCTNKLGEGIAPSFKQCTANNNLEHSQNSSTAHSAHKLFGAGRATTIISSNNFNIHKISKNLQSIPSTSSYVKDVERNFNTELASKSLVVTCKSNEDHVRAKYDYNKIESEKCISKIISINDPQQHNDAVESIQTVKKLSKSAKKSKIQLLNKLKRLRSKDGDSSEDSDAPLVRKTRMLKVYEQSRTNLRHTKVRPAVQTEKILHEAVNVASVYKHKMRQQCKRSLPLSNKEELSRELIDSATPIISKRYRHCYLFDLSNFDYAIRMCLRRPRPFLGLFKMMKHQLRVLGKRRWVEIHKRRYDKELFNKFIRTKDISEVKMFEKINLLKAEQDMEHILGITREEARKMEISALRDSRTPLFNPCYLKDVDKWDSRCVDATNSVAFHHSSGLVLEPAYAYMTQMTWGYEKGEKCYSYYDLKRNKMRIPAEISDSENDCYRPGDFSPFSTDDEWNKFYEKKHCKEAKNLRDHCVPEGFVNEPISYVGCQKKHTSNITSGEQQNTDVILEKFLLKKMDTDDRI